MDEIIHADTLVRTGPEWAVIIRNDLGRAVEGIVSAGQHLTEAKASVSHGEWIPMLNGIGISARVAQRLMSIGSNDALSNATNVAHLPHTIRALYEISRLEPEEIEHGVEDGVIHPDMTTQDARNMKPQPRKSSPFEKAKKNLMALTKHIDSGLSPNELKEILDATQRIIDTTGRRR